jgi:hypothetical protein
MFEDVILGGDETNDDGIDVSGEPPTPLERLVDWTDVVRAFQIARALFPDLAAVVDNDGYCGPIAEDSETHLGVCWLLCGTQASAEAVFRYLDDYCVELDLLPSIDKDKALVYIQHHKFNVLSN